MTIEKAVKHCSQCETKYTITWDLDEQDLEPLTCPFCGYEVELEDADEDRFDNKEEDDNWN